MYFSDIITLKPVTYTRDGLGDSVRGYGTGTDVYANKKSVTRQEFYSASMAGIKVDAVFEIHSEDYSNQEAVTYSGANYDVIRAYQKGKGTVELMCVKREVG